ncbi:MAG: hypothetical protein IJG23_03830 [Clostridia bacterium]|nr:hypothetical protein [Clostridia bacterium]
MMKISNKSFNIFAMLVSLTAPYLFLYIRSDCFQFWDNLSVKDWRQCVVVFCTVLCVWAMCAVLNRLISFVAVYVLCLGSTVLEPVYIFTVFPVLIGMWCFSALDSEEQMLFSVAFSGSEALAAIIGAVMLLSGMDISAHYETHLVVNKAVFVPVAIMLVFAITLCILLSKNRQTLPKGDKKQGKPHQKKQQAEHSKWIVLLFFSGAFLLLDIIVFLHDSAQKYLLYILGTLCAAILLVCVMHKYSCRCE